MPFVQYWGVLACQFQGVNIKKARLASKRLWEEAQKGKLLPYRKRRKTCQEQQRPPSDGAPDDGPPVGDGAAAAVDSRNS